VTPKCHLTPFYYSVSILLIVTRTVNDVMMAYLEWIRG